MESMSTLKREIKRAKLTQAEVARRLGVSSQLVGYWAKFGLPPKRVGAMAKLLGADKRKLCPGIEWD
jgi:transcriptional regulator with XRE-family HTH domain